MLKLKLENECLYSVYKTRWYWFDKRVGEIFCSESYWFGVMRTEGLSRRTQTTMEILETEQFKANKDPVVILNEMKLSLKEQK